MMAFGQEEEIGEQTGSEQNHSDEQKKFRGAVHAKGKHESGTLAGQGDVGKNAAGGLEGSAGSGFPCGGGFGRGRQCGFGRGLVAVGGRSGPLAF